MGRHQAGAQNGFRIVQDVQPDAILQSSRSHSSVDRIRLNRSAVLTYGPLR